MNDISPETAQECGFPDFFFVYFIVICVIDYISQVGGEYCGEIFEIVYGLCRSCVVVLKVSFSISSFGEKLCSRKVEKMGPLHKNLCI